MNSTQSTQGIVKSGQTASGIVQSLGVTPQEFLSANPNFAAKGGANDYQGLTGLITPGMTYNIPSKPSQNTVTQSTPTLTSDKSSDITKNTNTLNTLSNKGISTNPSTGVSTYADGTAYNPTVTTTPTVTADTSSEDAKINDFYNQMTASLDATTKMAIDNIKTKFDALRAEQRDINEKQQKGIQTALLTGGVTGTGSSSQYAPISSAGITATQMSYGLKQIANLDAQEMLS